MKQSKVFIIILHYGSLNITKECIGSILKNETYPFQIILVNNDPSLMLSKKYFSSSKVIIINSGKNLGFAGGVNVGIRIAQKGNAEYIFLLNNDTQIQKPILEKLLSTFLNNENIGIVAPSISFIKNDQKVFDLGGKLNNLEERLI